MSEVIEENVHVNRTNYSCEDILVKLVESNLSLYLYKSARFYAERLYNLFSSESNLHLLAKCYHSENKTKQTYLLLQGCSSIPNRYLLALACIDLNKYDEGERVLLSSIKKNFLSIPTLSMEDLNQIPGGAAGLYLLGKIARKQHRKDTAIKYFKLSVEADAFMWCSINELCELGIDIAQYLPMNTKDSFSILSEFITHPSSNTNQENSHPNQSMDMDINDRFNLFVGLKKDGIHRNKILTERMSFGSSRNGGSPHTATALGLSSSAFHVPFASPGGIPRPGIVLSSNPSQNPYTGINESMNESMNEMDTLRTSQLGVSGVDTFNHPSSILSSAVQDNEEGRYTDNRLPSQKLFHMSSPSLTPIQSQSHSFLQSSAISSMTMDRSHTSEFNRINELPNRNLGFVDSSTVINSMKMNTSISMDMTPPMTSGPVTSQSSNTKSRDDSIHVSSSTVMSKNIISPAMQQRRKVNFGPTARLSFSSIGGNNSQEVNFEDMSDFDEHPPKLLRTTLDMDTDTIEISSTSISHPHSNESIATHKIPSTAKIQNKSSNRIDSEKGHQLDTTETTNRVTSLGFVMINALLTAFAMASYKLNSYQCQDCIDLLHALPSALFSCGYTQQLIGKSYFELNDYKLCVLAYREMLRLEPFRTQGLEYLSSALWHLRKDKELCALAQQIVEIDKLAPETWCVVGNCFSLQREPDSAMKFFSRAIQLDGSYPYAHTLLGHEYVHNEDFDRAIQSFRYAILTDERHYNSWYGLGAIYYRQERFELAEYHFRRAIAINSSSSVLCCYLAMVLHSQNKSEKTVEALQILTDAIARDPKNAQLHFQRAHVCMSVEDYEEVISELEVVRGLAPREPPVYTMLGRAYQQMGNMEEALRNFHYAIDLDPKEGQGLKAELEAIGEPNLDGILDRFL